MDDEGIKVKAIWDAYQAMIKLAGRRLVMLDKAAGNLTLAEAAKLASICQQIERDTREQQS